MTKSSDVLRLAAEKAFEGLFPYVTNAMSELGIDALGDSGEKVWKIMDNHDIFYQHDDRDQTITALCFAAAIAESEGD